MFHDLPDILTPSQARDALQIGKNTIYDLIHSGQIKSLKMGKNYRIPKKCLIDFVMRSCYNQDAIDCPQCRQEGEKPWH